MPLAATPRNFKRNRCQESGGTNARLRFKKGFRGYALSFATQQTHCSMLIKNHRSEMTLSHGMIYDSPVKFK